MLALNTLAQLRTRLPCLQTHLADPQCPLVHCSSLTFSTNPLQQQQQQYHASYGSYQRRSCEGCSKPVLVLHLAPLLHLQSYHHQGAAHHQELAQQPGGQAVSGRAVSQ